MSGLKISHQTLDEPRMPRRAAPLNAARLASLKPPAAGRIELYDGICPGLSFRLTP
jgi:hypothetical protein